MTSSKRLPKPSSSQVVALVVRPVSSRPPRSQVVEGVVLSSEVEEAGSRPAVAAPAQAVESRETPDRPCKMCGRPTKGVVAAFGLLRINICSRCVAIGANVAKFAIKR